MNIEKIFAKPVVEGLTIDLSNNEANYIFWILRHVDQNSLAAPEYEFYKKLKGALDQHMEEMP